MLFTVRRADFGVQEMSIKDLGSPESGFNTDGSSPYEIITSAVEQKDGQ